MPDLSQASRVTAIPPSLVARVAQAARYVISGVTPQTWFGPLQPLKPFAPEGTGGRAFDYPVGYNLQYAPRSYEPTSFSDLHALAANCDMLGLVIETRKDQLEAQDWTVRPRKLSDGKHPKASEFAAQIKDANAFFVSPDKEHDRAAWMRAIADEMFITDAASIYVRPDRKGRVYSFDVLDGSTIAPRIDGNGRTPKSPDVAYQQILHGVPAADFSRDQLIYFPRNRRPGHVYGYSPVEQVITTANILIRRNIHQLSYYTDGNLTDALFTSPEGWTTDAIKGWQNYWNSLFSGNLQLRRLGTWVPAMVDIKQIKQPNLKDPYDEFLARVICYAFSISPQPFVSMMNRATADTAHDAAIEEGLLPFLGWFERLYRVMFDKMGWHDIEMVASDDRETDPKTQNDIDVADVKTGIRPIDEVRESRGLDPLGGAASRAMVQTATGYFPIEANIDGDAASGQTKDPNTNQDGTPKPGPNDAPAAKLAKSVERKTAPTINRPVPRAAKKSIAATFAKALASEGKRLSKTVRKLVKDDASDEDRLRSTVNEYSFDDLSGAVDNSQDDLSAVSADAGRAAVLELGTADDGIFGVINTRAVSWAAANSADLVTRLDAATRNMLHKTIVQGMADGKSIAEIADDIEASGAFSEERAALIANTEVANANSAGALEGYKAASANGVALKKVWLLGADPCVVCIANAAMGAVSLSTPFVSGDLAPTAHPNCHCALGVDVGEAEVVVPLAIAA